MAEINEHPGVLLYTRIRKSPYFYASRRHGVQLYSVYNHTYHPRHYGDPVEEYWQLLNGVTLWDVGVERQIEISGPDAFDFTNLIVARDLNKCQVEQCKYVFNCLPDGALVEVARGEHVGELEGVGAGDLDLPLGTPHIPQRDAVQ